jgi:hypothetical protein
MHINPDSSVQLDEGEVFIEERQDEGNIWRTITLLMPTGAHVKVQRHFSQIGPNVFRLDGRQIPTTVDHTGAVVPIEVQEK